MSTPEKDHASDTPADGEAATGPRGGRSGFIPSMLLVVLSLGAVLPAGVEAAAGDLETAGQEREDGAGEPGSGG